MQPFKSGLPAISKTRRDHIRRDLPKGLFFAFRLLILISVGFVIIYPLLFMIVTSLVSRDGFFNSARVWIPEGISPGYNYSVAMDVLDYGRALRSTLVNEIASALIEVCTCAVTAYGFSRFRFKGRNLLLGVLFLTILVPDMMIIIPRMAGYSKMDLLGILGLFNRLTGIDLRPNLLGSAATFYLPSLFSMGLRSGILIFIYMQFFNGLPRELEEAAWIDGAGPARTFLSIALSSSGVVIITVLVFSLIWHWNDHLLSSMYLNGDYPLAMQLYMMTDNLTTRGFYIAANSPQTLAFRMAGCVLFVTPMLVVYMVLQRWFIESIDRVGITG